MKDNIYVVCGVFAKKSDNDITMYRIMFNRSVPDISTDEAMKLQLEIAKSAEEQLQQLVQQKGRKGTR